MRLYTEYLSDIEKDLQDNNLCSFSSMDEHTFAFLLTQGIDEENAWLIIDDFKGNRSQ